MIYAFTGPPGVGKTLSALDFLRSDKTLNIASQDNPDGRKLYVYGVPDLALDHIPLEDPTTWEECEDGSVIFVDEAWQHFPTRNAGKEVPKHVQGLATHRHRGMDFIFCTQSINDLDVFVRRRVNRYYQLRRPGNLPYAKRTLYEGVPDGENKVQEIQTEKWFYPKDVYDLYTSTTKDTHKVRMPKGTIVKVGIIALAPIFMGGLLWAGYNTIFKGDPLGDGERSTSGEAMASAGRTLESVEIIEGDWFDQFVPRDFRHPASAPFFDSVIEPESIPTVFCIAVEDTECSCMSEQGTAIDLDFATCYSYATDGYYQPWREKERESPSTAQRET